MADTAANRTYRGTITGNDTVTVRGRGECRIKVVGNDFDSGTVSLLDNLANESEFKAIDDKGVAQEVSSGSRSWYLRYNPTDIVKVRISMAGSTSPDVDVYVSFDDAPPAV